MCRSMERDGKQTRHRWPEARACSATRCGRVRHGARFEVWRVPGPAAFHALTPGRIEPGGSRVGLQQDRRATSSPALPGDPARRGAAPGAESRPAGGSQSERVFMPGGLAWRARRQPTCHHGSPHGALVSNGVSGFAHWQSRLRAGCSDGPGCREPATFVPGASAAPLRPRSARQRDAADRRAGPGGDRAQERRPANRPESWCVQTAQPSPLRRA